MFEVLIQFPIGFFIALSGALIPGPLLAFVVAKSSTHGARTGPLAVSGHILVELAVLSLIALGLGVVLQNRSFQVGVGLVGGILLVLMGTLSISKLTRNSEGAVITHYHPVVGGVMFSTVLNPTVILWWATLGLATLMEAFLVASLAGVVFWLAGHFFADLSWFSLVSFSVARGRKVLGTRGHRVLLFLCSCVLLILGIYFIGKYALPILYRGLDFGRLVLRVWVERD
jgi:threonine/homoserine/homoserine lactone efflux protein